MDLWHCRDYRQLVQSSSWFEKRFAIPLDMIRNSLGRQGAAQQSGPQVGETAPAKASSSTPAFNPLLFFGWQILFDRIRRDSLFLRSTTVLPRETIKRGVPSCPPMETCQFCNCPKKPCGHVLVFYHEVRTYTGLPLVEQGLSLIEHGPRYPLARCCAMLAKALIEFFTILGSFASPSPTLVSLDLDRLDKAFASVLSAHAAKG